MIPHTQKYFGNGDDGSTPGDCFRTAIASLLGYKVALDVPHFVDQPKDAPTGKWYDDTVAWLTEHGYRLTIFEDTIQSMTLWTDGVVSQPLKDLELPGFKGVTLLAHGMSERGLRHTVVWRDGELLHDPHPSGAGLVSEPDEYWLIEVKKDI